MSRKVRVFFNHIRENYLLSNVLAAAARPVWRFSRATTSQIQMKIAKNGLKLHVDNGKNVIIGRNAGISIASLLFWHGLNGYEAETSATDADRLGREVNANPQADANRLKTDESSTAWRFHPSESTSLAVSRSRTPPFAHAPWQVRITTAPCSAPTGSAS